MILNKVIVNYKACSYAKRDFSNFNEEKSVNGFSDLSVEFLHDFNTSLNSKFGMFIQTVSEYVNSKILRLIKYHDKLMRKLNKKFFHNNEYLHKKFSNQVVSELGTSRINYYNQYFAEHKSNMKMLWTEIKSIINIKSNKFYNISHLTQNGKIIDNPKDIAKIFNQYFKILLPKLIARCLKQENLLSST